MNYAFADRMNGMQASAIREILKNTADPSVISFAAGNPAPEAFPVDTINSIMNEIMSENPIGALQYSITEGYPPLRNKLKAQLKERFNIGKENDELIICTGAQEGIQLSCKALCNKGDTVICENPSFIGSLNAFKSNEANLVGVEMDDDGMNIEKLKKALDENKNTKLLYVIPNFQNPSGITTSLEKRRAIYDLCAERGVIILEDNPYGELRFDGENVENIKSFDDKGIVIYCGTFSKTLSPGLRVGYICGPKEIVQKVTVLKQVNDVHTNIMAQMICDKFLEKVDFDRHISRLREIYKKKSDLFLSEMKKQVNPKIKVQIPQGGLFIWCTLPDEVDMMEFCRRALEKKVAIVPGSAFMPTDNDKTNSFRLNFSTPTDKAIVDGVKLLGELSYEMIK